MEISLEKLWVDCGHKGLIGLDLGNRPLLRAPLKQACYETNYAE